MSVKRIPLVAGNWKMNNGIAEAHTLVSALGASLQGVVGVETVICPPFLTLASVQALAGRFSFGLGAQNMHWEEKGAYTGEISPVMSKEVCQYVIIGHSERRAYFCETDETVNKKVQAAHKHGLIPIVCVGETLEQFEAGQTAQVIRFQILKGLADISSDFAPKIVLAYEPIWAIGTGRASSAENAEKVHGEIIRPALEQLFGATIAQAIRVLYGGSVTSANASAFFACPNIDGALVGGASLKAEDFAGIVRAAAR